MMFSEVHGETSGRADPRVCGRIEKCDRCSLRFRTFRERPAEFICGPCSPGMDSTREIP